MKESILKQIKEFERISTELDNRYKENKEFIKELKKDKKVLNYLKLIETNKEIAKCKLSLKNEEELLIKQNCNHSIALYLGSEIDQHDCKRYYEYKCIECGELFESNERIENEVLCDISYNILNREYLDYLLKYGEIYALDMIMFKYGDNKSSELIENENEVHNLVKKNNERFNK